MSVVLIHNVLISILTFVFYIVVFCTVVNCTCMYYTLCIVLSLNIEGFSPVTDSLPRINCTELHLYQIVFHYSISLCYCNVKFNRNYTRWAWGLEKLTVLLLFPIMVLIYEVTVLYCLLNSVLLSVIYSTVYCFVLLTVPSTVIIAQCTVLYSIMFTGPVYCS